MKKLSPSKSISQKVSSKRVVDNSTSVSKKSVKKSNPVKKVSLVLGGGGARGFFHIGVLKALHELNIEVVEIVGVSVGALIGAIYAQNPNFNFENLLDDVSFLSISKMIKGEGLTSFKKINAEVRKIITVKRFSTLKIPLKFLATDINTGEEIVFEKGNIYPGLFASFAIPGVFPLVEWKNRILCDGGLTNDVPVDIVEGKKIVISDITIPTEKISLKSSKVHILKNTFLLPRKMFLKFRNELALKNKSSVTLEFHKHHHIFDFRREKLENMIKIGYETTMKNKKKILGL